MAAVFRAAGVIALSAMTAAAAEAGPSYAALDALLDGFAPWAGRSAKFRITQELVAMEGYNGSYGLPVSVIRE